MTSQRSQRTNPIILTASIAIIAILTGVTLFAATAAAQNPVPFTNQPLVPDAVAPGGAGFTLTVNGTGFVATSVVNWNGSPRATTFVSNSKVTAAIRASDIATASTAAVTVVSPSPGGGVSNTQFFSIAQAAGSVSFLPAVTYPSGGYIAQSVRIADLRADGKLDIVVANWWDTNNVGNVGVLIGNGDGTFQPAVTYETGGAPNYSLVVADVNGDGKLDLIVSSCSATASTCGSAEGIVSVLLGNGDGTFQPALSYGSGAPVGAHVAVADVNGDGKLDLIVTNYQGETNGDGTVAVLLGNGDGTFQLPVLYDSGAPGANAVTVADVNGDGLPDVLVADGCYSNCAGGPDTLTILSVLLGNGDGSLQPAVTYATGGKNGGWVSAADLNGDGKMDLVLASTNIFIPNGTVSVLLGVGNGTFGAPVTYDSGGYAAPELALADLNANGLLDIVVDNCGPVGGCGIGLIGMLLGVGGGSFDPVITFSSGAYNATSIAVADLNGDGLPDLVAANQCAADGCTTGSVAVLLNNAGPCVKKCLTSTSLASSLNPSIYGQNVTWTATVTTSGPVPPTGKVNFVWGDGNYLGAGTLNSTGVATLTRFNLNADPYPLIAVYVGDADNAGSTSAILNQLVQQTTSAATITSSPNPSTHGQAVTFTAKITSPTATPTGPVTFTAGKTVLGTVGLSKGKATLTTSTLPVGSTTVTVTYPWNSDISGSSASVTQTVQQ